MGAVVLTAAALIGSASGAGAAALLTGKNIADNSLRSIDFRDNAIGAGKFREGGLTPADLGFDVAGDPGDPGRQGPTGPSGITSITVRQGPRIQNTTTTLDATAVCDSGEIALSGGAQLDSASAGAIATIQNSHRLGTISWTTAVDVSVGTVAYIPWVICARVA